MPVRGLVCHHALVLPYVPATSVIQNEHVDRHRDYHTGKNEVQRALLVA